MLTLDPKLDPGRLLLKPLPYGVIDGGYSEDRAESVGTPQLGGWLYKGVDTPSEFDDPLNSFKTLVSIDWSKVGCPVHLI